MKRWFSMEGSLYSWLNRIGNLIVLSVLFLIGCIPVITVGTSLISLYYAVVKSVRFGVGYPVSEFWHSYKRNFLKGIFLSVWVLVLLVLLDYGQLLPALVSAVLLPVYIPAASRFGLSVGKLLELTFVMSVRYFYLTLLLLVGIGVLALLQLFFLPWLCILFLPGGSCYLASFLTERVLRAYTPKPEDGQKQWFDQ